MKALVLRLRGPMMSFGMPAIDKHRPTADHPGRAQMTGLLANALGWERTEFLRLAQLQAGLRVASRADRGGTPLEDLQTVDFGQPRLNGTGWTTRGEVQTRSGSAENQVGTYLRYRHYLADAAYTVLVTVTPEAGTTLDALEQALRRPERPLFLGRSVCPPSMPLFDPVMPQVEGRSWVTCFDSLPLFDDHDEVVRFWLPVDESDPEFAGCSDDSMIRSWDLADWAGQAHRGTTREITFAVDLA